MFSRLFGSKKDPGEPDATFARSDEEMQLKTQFHMETWGLGSGTAWAADLEKGIITFTNDRGWTITAPVQVVGTLNPSSGTWLWGWDHPSVSEPLAADARLVQAFGKKYGLEAFTTRKIEADEEDGWTFTSLACHLAGAQGGYRGPAGDALVFMTFGQITISKDDPS